MFLKTFGLPRADLLAHLAKAGFHDRLAMVDSALWHLPGFGAVVDAAPGEQQIVGVQQENSDAGTVRTVGIGNVGHEAGFIAPKTDTPRMRSRARAS